MTEYARVKNGVIRPLAGALDDPDEHSLIVERHLQDGRYGGSVTDPRAHSRFGCELNLATLLFLRHDHNSNAKVAILEVKACPHQTYLELSTEEIGIPSAKPLGPWPDEPVRALKRILAESSRAGDFSTIIEQFRTWLQTDLEIHLNETIRHPYHKALSWRPGPDSDDLHTVLHPLLTARAALLDIYALARARGVHTAMVESIQSASQRIETALLSLTAWQTAILEQAAQNLAESAARSEREERAHDRRIADLGAITLFPLLLFGFLGANILPNVKFPFELDGIIVLIISLATALFVALSGRAWIRRQHHPEDLQHKANTGNEQ